jgi:NTE family protein
VERPGSLFDDGRLEIETISGTSAGAMNVVVATDGMMNDGYEGARRALRNFWKAVSVFALPSPYKRTFYDIITGNWSLDHSPGYLSFELISRIASPYDLNSLNNNPLKDFLAEQIIFERVRSPDGMKLFIDLNSVLD